MSLRKKKILRLLFVLCRSFSFDQCKNEVFAEGIGVDQYEDKALFEGDFGSQEGFARSSSVVDSAFVNKELLESSVIEKLLEHFDRYAGSISRKLDFQEDFLSGILDVYVLMEASKNLEDSHFISIDKMITKMIRKVYSKDFIKFKPYVNAIKDYYNELKGSKDKKLNLVFDFYPDVAVFLKHIDKEMKHEETFFEALKDLFLIFEHEAVSSDLNVRKGILRRIRNAIDASRRYDADFYKSHILELIDKALLMEDRLGKLIWPNDDSRERLEKLKKSLDDNKKVKLAVSQDNSQKDKLIKEDKAAVAAKPPLKKPERQKSDNAKQNYALERVKIPAPAKKPVKKVVRKNTVKKKIVKKPGMARSDDQGGELTKEVKAVRPKRNKKVVNVEVEASSRASEYAREEQSGVDLKIESVDPLSQNLKVQASNSAGGAKSRGRKNKKKEEVLPEGKLEHSIK